MDEHLSTIIFWISFFMCLLMIYGLNTWLPKLMDGAGLSVSGLMFLFVLNFGAIFGAIFGGRLADRWNSKSVFISIFYLSCSFFNPTWLGQLISFYYMFL